MKTIAITLIMFCATLIEAQSIQRFRTTALDTASVLVNSGFTSVSNLNIAYAGTAIVYVKFYDASAKVYAKANTPAFTYQLGSDAALGYSLQSYSNLKFKNGLWLRCTSGITDTAQTATEPANKPIIEITY